MAKSWLIAFNAASNFEIVIRDQGNATSLCRISVASAVVLPHESTNILTLLLALKVQSHRKLPTRSNTSQRHQSTEMTIARSLGLQAALSVNSELSRGIVHVQPN